MGNYPILRWGVDYSRVKLLVVEESWVLVIRCLLLSSTVVRHYPILLSLAELGSHLFISITITWASYGHRVLIQSISIFYCPQGVEVNGQALLPLLRRTPARNHIRSFLSNSIHRHLIMRTRTTGHNARINNSQSLHSFDS